MLENYRWCIDQRDPKKNLDFCGNGAVEKFFGEECDDGNMFNNDGCDRECRI